MIDGQGRTIDYVRISVTDRCDMRCKYCMPEEGIAPLSHKEILTYEEITRLIRIFAGMGITKVKLTGGEPLARKNLSALVSQIYENPEITDVTLTTNGQQLSNQLDGLYNAGIRSINISIDALDNNLYSDITRGGNAEKALDSINKVLTYHDINLKLNCVPLKGVNESELSKLALMAKDHPICVRFIELMPIGFGKGEPCLSEDDIRENIYSVTGELTAVSGDFGNGPCRYFNAEGFKGKIGFISSVSHKFCDNCNRIRITADGFLKTCLQFEDGVSLKALLRDGSSDNTIKDAIISALKGKPIQHQFLEKETADNLEKQSMSQIGG